MKAKIIIIFLTFPVLLNANTTGQSADGLQIHLPREMAVKDQLIKLGDVSVITGQEDLAAAAGQVSLGTLSVPGQKIVIDRITLLGRLASNNIPADKVTITGAEKVVISRNQNIITGEELVRRGQNFLQKTPGYSSASNIRPARMPKDLVLPLDSNGIQLNPSLTGKNTASLAYVQIDVLSNGKEISKVQLPFQIRYKVQKAVGIEDIEAGEKITVEKIKIVEQESEKPAAADWKGPVGLVARKRIAANREIESDMVTEPMRAVVINRNQNVMIKVDRGCLSVTATGKALEKGSTGECIKVKNIDSSRVIIAKIKEDGTVEPVF
jgi:flagella basal body P-ring formation protein FlgA